MYPKKDGLINSLRWEQMRNGIQDYEYFWMLENKINKIRETLSERLSKMIEPSRRGVEIASQVIRTMSDYSKDPNALYNAKKQIIEELLDLDKSPRLIVQTNPLEHTPIANDCAVDVFGWAEPGTKIVVNNRESPVSSDGLFMENIPLTWDSTIVVKAKNEKGEKTIVRSFEVMYPKK